MLILVVLVLIGGFAGLWLWMKNEFKAMSLDALEKNGKQFMNLADATLQPLKESMQLLNEHQRDLEKRREGAYGALSQQIEGLILSEKELRSETVRLVQALKSSQIRGSWGEVHLRRVVELAGLMNHCDFYEQKTFEEQGRIFRPDLIIRLPGHRQIAIDAKAPLHAYLEAAEIQDDQSRKTKLQEHALSVRKHIKHLSAKEYWKQLDPAPEFVILFLPAEAFFSAALQADPSLIEIGADQNIIVATPTTLIAILRAVAHGWKQESLSKSALEISRLGQELYDRIGIVSDHWNKVGKSLNAAVESYNQSIASLESRVLVSARKLKESGSLMKEMPELSSIDKVARETQPVE
jgi:DNA recombination protein RmuC